MSSPPELRIRSAADLVGALRQPDPYLHLSVLRHVGRHPDKALAYGRHEGHDVLDVLIDQVRSSPFGQFRQLTLMTVCNFKDARAIRFLMDDLPGNIDPQSVVAIIVRLAEEKTDSVRALLEKMQLRDPFSAHARTAASVLAWWPDWQPDLSQRVRMAILSDVGRPQPPPFDAESASIWLEYLRGETAGRAWMLLELQGQPTFVRICMHWASLDDAQRLALLRWGGRSHLQDVPPLLRQTLASSDTNLVLEALRLLALLPAAQESHLDRLRELWQDERLEIRRAVVRAGLRDVDWEAALAGTQDLALRRELLTAYARQRPADALPFALQCLEAQEWQLRATAVRLAIEAGEAAVEGARLLIRHERTEVRVAACQALIALGQQNWLEENLL